MEIKRIEEFAVDQKTSLKIEALLRDAFPDYPSGRIYFKQIPDFRYLVWEQQKLVGHMAVEYRLINVDGQVVPIFGVVDLCVANAFQHNNIASNLLSELAELGKKNAVEFIVLIAKDKELYRKNGFRSVKNTCKWLLINNHQTFGVGFRRIGDDLMIKGIGTMEWKEGVVDFLGPIF